MPITEKQRSVLDELRKIGRANVVRYRESEPYLYAFDLRRLAEGDATSAWGMGGLSYQVGHRLGMKAGSVLAIFKALEHKGLVVRDQQGADYQRPMYWWPVGLATQLAAELIPATPQQ